MYSRYLYCVSGDYRGFQGTGGPYTSYMAYDSIEEAVQEMEYLKNDGDHENMKLFEMIQIDVPKEMY
jgi:hypothetical protein